MAEKKFYESMKAIVEQQLKGQAFDLLNAELRTSTNKNGEIEESCRYSCEVQRGNGSLSRCRFTVKVPGTDLKVNPQTLANDEEFEIRFENLKISFIDPKGNVYFRADSAEVFSLQEVTL